LHADAYALSADAHSNVPILGLTIQFLFAQSGFKIGESTSGGNYTDFHQMFLFWSMTVN
jgi:hypothetical protein